MAKTTEVHQVTIGEHAFGIRLFEALASMRIAANAIAVLSPLLGGLGALADGDETDGSDESFLDKDHDLSAILPAMATALGGLDGKRAEFILKELLLNEGKIAVEDEDGNPAKLTQKVLDELFCGDLFGMLTLAYEVIKLNYGGLFTMLGGQSGVRALAHLKSLV